MAKATSFRKQTVTALLFLLACGASCAPTSLSGAESSKPISYQPPKEQVRAQIKWVKPICVETNRYIGWPTVYRLKNGEMMAVFSGDRQGHVCPYGKVQMIRSKDDGETWSAPVTIANGILDDRDAGIMQMPDGEILVTHFTSIAYLSDPAAHIDRHPEYRWHHEKIPPEMVKESLGYFRTGSVDGGKTWSKPFKMYGVNSGPHGPILLRDGSLFALGRSFRDAKSAAATGKPIHQCIISAWRSDDRGFTWKCLCPEIADRNGENAKPKMMHEPSVLELPDGTLLGMVRYHGPDGCLRQTSSRDGGRTWTPFVATPMLGYPPHLIQLPDGKIVCVYGRRVKKPHFGEYAQISDDGGKTWDSANEIVLSIAPSGDLGYPASCLGSDGSIVTIYYQRLDAKTLPCLMATKWRITK